MNERESEQQRYLYNVEMQIGEDLDFDKRLSIIGRKW